MGLLSNAFVIYEDKLGKLVPPVLFLGSAYGAYGAGALVGTVLAKSMHGHGHGSGNLLHSLMG